MRAPQIPPPLQPRGTHLLLGVAVGERRRYREVTRSWFGLAFELSQLLLFLLLLLLLLLHGRTLFVLECSARSLT